MDIKTLLYRLHSTDGFLIEMISKLLLKKQKYAKLRGMANSAAHMDAVR
jgi:hypothetical protein